MTCGAGGGGDTGLLSAWLYSSVPVHFLRVWDSGYDLLTISGELAGFLGRGLQCPAAAGGGMLLKAEPEPPCFHSQVLQVVRLALQSPEGALAALGVNLTSSQTSGLHLRGDGLVL